MAAAVPYIPQMIGAAGSYLSARRAASGSSGGAVVDTSTDMDRYLRQNSGEIINHYLTFPDQIWKYNGPFAAGLTGAEQGGLSTLQNFLLGSGAQSVTNSMGAIDSILSGQASNPLISDPRLSTAGRNLTGDILEGRTMNPETDALLQRAIATAQRPITERFADELAGARSAFAQAGQSVGGGRASSPFELANAKLQSGLASALGDVATNISFGNLMNERQRQDAILGRQDAAAESGLNRRLSAADSAVSNARTVIDSLNEGMRGLALPRIIEQAGLEGGLGEFNYQRDQFYNMLMNAFTGSAGNPVVVPGTSSPKPDFLGSMMQAYATANADLKKD